jgi:hypothetical protein
VDQSAVQVSSIAKRPDFTAAAKPASGRRWIHRALAALGKMARAETFHQPQAATRPTPSEAARVTDEAHRGYGARSRAVQFGVPRDTASAATTRRVVVSERQEAPIRAEFGADAPPASRRPGPAWATAFANDETPRDPRRGLAIDRPSSTDAKVPHATRSSTDDRWPRFPPGVFAPPSVAAVPSPRLDQLAREQEEGRWSV